MSKPIGPREAELRRQREANAKPKPLLADIAAALPATSGKKPIKRKATRSNKRPRTHARP